MAKPGNFAAYQQSSPIQEDFGNNMLQAEDQQFRYRAEKQAKEQEAYLRKREQDKDFMADLDKQKLIKTGFEPVDKHLTQVYYDSMTRMGELHREYASGNLSAEQRQQNMFERSMLNKMPEFLETSTANVTKYATAVAEGLENGTISRAAERELETAKALIAGRIKSMSVKNGVPMATVVTESGEVKEVDFGRVVGGFDFSTADLPKTVDGDGWAKTIGDELGKRQKPAIERGMAGVKQAFDDQRENTEKLIDKQLGSPNNPSPFALSMWVDHNNLGKDEEFTPESYAQIKDYLMSKVEAGYDQTFSGSQYRPNTSGGRMTDGERNYQRESYSLYDLSYRGARGDADALQSLIGQSRRVDGDVARTVHKAYRSGNKVVLEDSKENVIQEIDTSNPALAEKELIQWYGKGTAAELTQQYKDGRLAYGGTPQVGELAPEFKAEPVPAIDMGKALGGIDLSSAKKLREGLNKNKVLSEAGFSFDAEDEYLTMTAPDGTTEKIEFRKDDKIIGYSDRPEAKEDIRAFIEKHAPKKTSYKPGQAVSTTAPSENDPLGLGL